MRLRRLRLTAGLLALVVGAGACVTGAKAGGALKVASLEGSAQVREAGEDAWQPLARGATVPNGATVRTGQGAALKLSSGSVSYELSGGSEVTVVESERLTANHGSLLAEAGKEPVSIVDSEKRAYTAKNAAFRLDHNERVGVYRGIVRVELPGDAIDLPAGLEIAIGLADPSPQLFKIAESDEWDRRRFEDAFQIDERLAPHLQSFDVNTPGGPNATLSFLGRFVSPGAIAFMEPMLRPGGELAKAGKFATLVEIFIAIERANAGKIELPDAMREVRTWRALGASLGMTAQLLAVKRAAIERRVVLALSPAPPKQTPDPQPTGGGPGGPRPTVGPSGGGTPRPSGSPTPTGSPSPSPDPSGSPSPPPPSPSPSPSPTCSVVDQVLGRC